MKNSVSINDYQYSGNLMTANKQSKVYKATNSVDPDLPPLVFKGYPEAYLNNPHKEKKLVQELNFLWKFRGKPNIIQIISQHYRDHMIFIITQYCEGGDLSAEIRKKGPFPMQKAVAFIKQIINGFRFVHEAKMIHRNLEPSSILISEELEVKISNFSQAIYMKDAVMALKREEMVGVLAYQAPEVLERYAYSTQSDIYSIALIFLFMLKGAHPFNGTNKFEILKHIKEINLAELIGPDIEGTSRDFLMKALRPDPNERMQVEQLLSFHFDFVPQLPLNKFYTFQQPDLRSGGSSQKTNKQLETIQKHTSPVGMIRRKPSQLDLKASDDFEGQSGFPKDRDISIFIPSKLHAPVSSKLHSKKDFFKMFEVESNICLQYQPSLLVLPTEKDGSVRSHSNRSRRSSIDMVIAVKSDSASKSSGVYNIQSLSKKNSHKVQMHPSSNKMDNKRNTSRKNVPSMLSPCNEDPVIEIHSPRKNNPRPPSTDRSQIQPNHEEEIIANWLLSQVDLIRYLTRACYRIGKLQDPQNTTLIEGLFGLRTTVRRQLQNLSKLDSREVASFQDSPSHVQLIEIAKTYEQRCREEGRELSKEELKRILKQRVLSLFERVRRGSRVQPEQLLALDYMVYCWKLINLYDSSSLGQFYERSYLQELLEGEKMEANITRVLDIHVRLKQFRLIQD